VLGDEEQISLWLSKLWDLEAERTDELKSYEELMDQVEIAQGKKADPAVTFGPADYSLPVDSQDDDTPVEQHARRERPAVFEAPAPVAKKETRKSKEVDVSFDIDLDSVSGMEVEADWVKDLQRQVNESV
jgi:hypothetical protein